MELGGKPIDFEDPDEDDVFGRGKVEDFTWKGMLDFATCTECGRCQSQCPAWNTGKPLSPKLRDHGPARPRCSPRRRTCIGGKRRRTTGASTSAGPPPTAPTSCTDVSRVGLRAADPGSGPVQARTGRWSAPLEQGGVIDPDVLWSCTTCGACVEQCPVDIEHVDHIVDMRRYQVLIESEFPSEVGVLFRNLENKGNPWGHERHATALDWTKELDFEVPVFDGDADSLDDVEYLFWVGCAGAFEDRAKKTTQAIAELLHRAGVNFAVLGDGETCTGDPARRVGQRVPLPDARAAERRDAQRPFEGATATARSSRPARTASTPWQRVPAARRQLRGRAPHPAARPAGPRRASWSRCAPVERATSPTTTPATWAGTTRSTRRRASSSAASGATLTEMPRNADRSLLLRRRRRAHVDGGAASASGSTSSAPTRRWPPARRRSPSAARSAG